MKRIILISLLAMLAVSSYAQRGRASVGAQLGYALDWQAATIGFNYRYELRPDVHLAPSLVFMTRNKGMMACYMDFDAHYVVSVSEVFSFYPIGGIGLSIWNMDLLKGNAVRPGLNVGLGGELRLSPEISVGLDMKYNLIHTYDQALVAVRVGYHF
jgi:outer membrane protein X